MEAAGTIVGLGHKEGGCRAYRSQGQCWPMAGLAGSNSRWAALGPVFLDFVSAAGGWGWVLNTAAAGCRVSQSQCWPADE